MLDDPYLCLTIGIQALRRKAEALGPAMGGALGVAAEPYPHQLATVRRILSDTSIRHLVSDEVGLGKTVQALMILNALRYQNPDHKAVVVVPDRLVRQWLDECWTRAHIEATVFGEGTDDRDTVVRIVRPQSIQSGQFNLDPAAFDLLIVDEPQLLPVAAMRAIETRAPDFRQVLILSATPGLTDPQRRRQMMTILESERARIAANRFVDLDVYLDEMEKSTLDDIDGGEVTDRETAWRTYSRERRIIRSTRSDWSRYLPERRYERVETDPLAGEVARVDLGMKWLREADEDGAFVWRAAQALHRGTESARGQRRLRSNPDLEEAVRRSSETPGDSRFDALLDILAGIWTEHPGEQVIIVAGDNPTIDYLETRLRRYFSEGDDDFPVATLRRASERTEGEAADIEAVHRQLSEFSEGHARVLLIGEWVQAGLNLHYFARNIVFYSSPWDIDVIDQLTGRLDRLRPNGLARGDAGRHSGSIRIWSIVQPATPEAQVVAALETLGVYQKPLPPLRPETESEISGALAAIAFRGDADARNRLAGLSESWASTGSMSLMSHFSPFSPARAQACYDWLQETPLPEPVLRISDDATFTARSEQGLRGFLDLLHRANVFDISMRREKEGEGFRFSTLWYGEDRNDPAIPISVIPKGGWMAGHIPFLWRRRHLARPPRNTVHYDEGDLGGRLLRFLDHGEVVHEEIVQGGVDLARRICNRCQDECLTVQFDPAHPVTEVMRGKQVFLRAGLFDPVSLLPDPDVNELEEHFASAPTEAQQREADEDRLLVREWWLADARWLNVIVPAQLLAVGLMKGADGWSILEREIVLHLLNPLGGSEQPLPRSRGRITVVSKELRKVLDDHARQHLHNQASASIEKILGDCRSELAARRSQLKAELDDLVESRQAHFERVKSADVEIDVRRAGMLAGLERRVENARLAARSRLAWLQELETQLTQPDVESLPGLMIQVSSTDAN
ncbi:hypothetical protein SZ64_15005 [Erythrobacter sp. SG61-1L]|uniref:SNF2-related protein n=1 Tax=Erythrobacter sp. SG61-1L TaxID=1603897 RepID=UPI0006C91D08|nr:SNF2-related protein [Erythrobacter sp. SG61-1L]KPL69298.1 hypothetical protein SZ64_15005 [Erythrobacter sp. SG61-1L]